MEDWISFVTKGGGALIRSLLLLIVIVALIIVVPETLRHYSDFTMGSLEQKVQILESLEKLGQSDLLQQDKDLHLAHNVIKNEFMEHIRNEHSALALASKIWRGGLNHAIPPLIPFFVLMLLVCRTKSDKRIVQIGNLLFWYVTLVGMLFYFGSLTGEPRLIQIAISLLATVLSVFLWWKWFKT